MLRKKICSIVFLAFAVSGKLIDPDLMKDHQIVDNMRGEDKPKTVENVDHGSN